MSINIQEQEPTITLTVTEFEGPTIIVVEDRSPIPTKLSQMSNDVGFLSEADLEQYAAKSWVEEQGYITELPDISNKADKSELFSRDYNDLENAPINLGIDEVQDPESNKFGLVSGKRLKDAVDVFTDDLKDKVDAALTKTFTPWQPEVIEGTGIDLPNVIGMFGSSDPIALTGSTVRMERTGFPFAEDSVLANGLKSDSINFGDTTSLYYKVKSSLDVEVVGSPTYIGFANSAFESWALPIASISGGTLSLESIGNIMGGGVEVTDFNPPIEVIVTDDSEYCVSYDKALNKITFFVDGVEIASHTFATDFGFDVVTGSVYVNASNYQGDPSALTLWGETEFLSDPAHPIAGLEPLIIAASASTIDETKYPENPEGKGYEIIGLTQPVQWDELGKEVKNGDFIVFDNAGLPKEVGDEPDLSEYTKRSADETITGDWDFQGATRIGDYTYNTMYGPYPVEKIITYNHPSLSSPMSIAYGIATGNTFSSMRVAFNIDDLGLWGSIVTELLTEESSVTGGYTGVYSITTKESGGTVQKEMVIDAYAEGGMASASIAVVSRSDGVSHISFITGTEPVRGMYASDILTESGGITIKAALDNKAEKIQVKAALEDYLKAKTTYRNVTLVNNLFTNYDGGASKAGDTLTFTSDGKARYVLDKPLNVGDTIAYAFTVTENNETALTFLGLYLGYDANLSSSIGLYFKPLLPNVVYAAVIHIKTTDTAEVCLVDVSTGESSASVTPPATVPLPEPLSTLLHVGVIASRGSAWGGNVAFKDESLENDSLEVRYFADLVQETGDSQTHVMSQKAVTVELDNKVDKIQVKEIVTTTPRVLTAADSGKLLIINEDGITITLPANSDFNIDIAKMDEDFITIVECSGTDNFREGTATISVIRDVSITNSRIVGKEWLAIGAYEV